MSPSRWTFVLSCVLASACSRYGERSFTSFSRAWDPNYAPGECRAHYEGQGKRRHLVCDPLPLPDFEVASVHSLLSGENLMGADLRHMDLSDAHLTYANLTQANLEGASLFEANLFRARLRDADLTDSDLTRADLTDADLTRAKFVGTNVEWADLEGAIFAQAAISGVRWYGTKCPDGTFSNEDGGTCAEHLFVMPLAEYGAENGTE